jgi:hypothetical protein
MFHPQRLRSIAICLGFGFLACVSDGGGGAGGGGWEAAVDTVGDTVVVRTLSGSVWGDTAYLEAEASIGMLEGPDEYLIGDPRSFAVGAGGAIYVLDRQVPVIRMYGSDGTFIRNVGREGGGPGEYESPGAIAVLPDDRLIVRDPGNGRVSIFSSEGEYLEQVWYPGGFNTGRRLYTDTAGFAYSMVLLNYGTAPWDWIFGLASIDPAKGIKDTIPAPTWDYEPPQITASRENSSSSDNVPFSPEDYWTFSPLGYMVGGLSTDYRVDLYRVNEPVLRIERTWTPVPVQRQEAEEQRRYATDNMQRQYSGWKWNGPGVPDTKPPFTNLLVSWEGNIWVQISQEGYARMTEAEARAEEERADRPQLRFTEPAAYDVFSPDGTYQGHVQAPRSFRASPEPLVRGDYVWAVTRDELDVARVVRFRIVTP